MVILLDIVAAFSASAHRSASRRADARIGLEAGRLDAGYPAFLVVLRSVAGDPDRADDLVCAVADQNPANDRHEPAAARRRERGEEQLRARRAPGERPPAEPHAEGCPGLAEGDVEPEDAGLVLALEGDEMPAGIEHGDGKR